MDDVNEAAVSAPGVLELGGRTFVIDVPGPGDWMAYRNEARRRVQAEMADPVAAVNAMISEAEKQGVPYSPTVVKAMVSDAMAARTGKEKKCNPTDGQIQERVMEPDMVKWWAWFLIRKADKAVTLAWVNETVADDDVYTLSHRLGELCQVGKADPN